MHHRPDSRHVRWIKVKASNAKVIRFARLSNINKLPGSLDTLEKDVDNAPTPHLKCLLSCLWAYSVQLGTRSFFIFIFIFPFISVLFSPGPRAEWS